MLKQQRSQNRQVRHLPKMPGRPQGSLPVFPFAHPICNFSHNKSDPPHKPHFPKTKASGRPRLRKAELRPAPAICNFLAGKSDRRPALDFPENTRAPAQPFGPHHKGQQSRQKRTQIFTEILGPFHIYQFIVSFAVFPNETIYSRNIGSPQKILPHRLVSDDFRMGANVLLYEGPAGKKVLFFIIPYFL